MKARSLIEELGVAGMTGDDAAERNLCFRPGTYGTSATRVSLRMTGSLSGSSPVDALVV